MRKIKLPVTSLLAFTLLFSTVSFGASPSSASASLSATGGSDPFHIGIFNPPPPESVNAQSYAEIAGMNVNFIVGGNSHYTYGVNDRALTFAAQNGLQILVADTKLGWYEPVLAQTVGDATVSVDSANPWGQTIESPDTGTGWSLNTVDLQIDKTQWPQSATLTLSLYDSPAKTTLIGSDSITGPGIVDGNASIFRIHQGIEADKAYYLELTSNSAVAVGVAASASDVYAGGEAYVNQTADSGKDLWFKVLFSKSVFNDGGEPAQEALEDIVLHYWNHPALMGYNLYDEPPSALFTRLGYMIKRLKTLDPDHMSLVNLLPSDAPSSMLGLMEHLDGSVLNSVTPIGQTFTTGAHETNISSVQWYVPWDQWQSGEQVTLKLWDSPAQSTLIAQTTLNQSAVGTNSQPRFLLNAEVQPNTTYYLEFTHNGGGDNFLGVWRSQTGDNWYNGGNAYSNGQPMDSDFWFTINQNIAALSYEDYVYRWVRAEPDVLLFDYYPFLADGGFSQEYYNNLEIIRRQAKAGAVDFWTFVQSVGIGNWLRSPSENDMRYNVYTNLAYGSKGLIYFTYSHPIYPGFNGSIINPDGTQNPSYGWARDLNAEVLNLGTTLNRLTSEAVYHTGSAIPPSTTVLPGSFFWKPDDWNEPFVISSFKDENERQYVMVVNRDMAASRTSTFTLSTKPGSVMEVSKTTGAEVQANYNRTTGSLTAAFAPGEGRLYAVDAEAVNLAPTATPQSLTVLANSAISGTLVADDPEDESLTYSIVDNGVKGVAAITNAATGAFTYTPQAGATGSDSFTFKVNDGHSDSNTAAVTIGITPEVAATASAGGLTGTTKVTAAASVGNRVVVKTSATLLPTPGAGDAVPSGAGVVDPYVSGTDIGGVTSGTYVGVYEIDATNKIAGFKLLTLTSGQIKAPPNNPGSGSGTAPASGPATVPESGPKTPVVQKEEKEKPSELSFKDIADHWAASSIKQAIERGIVNGYSDGTFQPNRSVTRAEFIAMLMRALKLETKGAKLSYADANDIGAWAQAAIAQAVEAGIVTGFKDNTFRPNHVITRAEMASLAARALNLPLQATGASGFSDDTDIPQWAKGAIAAARDAGILQGQPNNRFNPSGAVSRAEAVTAMIRLLSWKSVAVP